MGSPPQVRGKHRTIYCRKQQRRITPAGAGKTSECLRPRCAARDHPRRCGENRRMQPQLPRPRGSPPQVRGKLPATFEDERFLGITPAGAGKTSIPFPKVSKIWDHPRRCGENSQVSGAHCASRGSPPQVRGKPPTWEDGIPVRRITPAGAGKTHSPELYRSYDTDHPRRCGEN